MSTEQRIEWRKRMIEWLAPRLSGGSEEKKQFVAMFAAAMDAAHEEGIEDARLVVVQVKEASPSRHLDVVAEALAKLIVLNRASSVETIADL